MAIKTITKARTLAASFETEARFGIKTITKEANFGYQNKNKNSVPARMASTWVGVKGTEFFLGSF